ncbi:MAG: hypothetical protein ACTSQJ_06055 [Promethearchaeota archaeon]
MKFDELFEKLEQNNPTESNKKLLELILSEYVTNDISFNFSHFNVDLEQFLTEVEFEKISNKYYEK